MSHDVDIVEIDCGGVVEHVLVYAFLAGLQILEECIGMKRVPALVTSLRDWHYLLSIDLISRSVLG